MTREFASLQIPIANNLFFQFVRWLRDDTGSCSVLCFVDNNNRFAGFWKFRWVVAAIAAWREAGLRGEEEKAEAGNTG